MDTFRAFLQPDDLYNEPFPETVAGRKNMFVGDERAATSAGLVGLRGSQQQQSRPGELTDLGLLASNNDRLEMLIFIILGN